MYVPSSPHCLHDLGGWLQGPCCTACQKEGLAQGGALSQENAASRRRLTLGHRRGCSGPRVPVSSTVADTQRHPVNEYPFYYQSSSKNKSGVQGGGDSPLHDSSFLASNNSPAE